MLLAFSGWMDGGDVSTGTVKLLVDHVKSGKPKDVFVSDGSIDSAPESGRHNAFRFLVKPHEMEKLFRTIQEAHDNRRKALKEAFMDELTELNSAVSSPMELVETTNRLRAKYEQG